MNEIKNVVTLICSKDDDYPYLTTTIVCKYATKQHPMVFQEAIKQIERVSTRGVRQIRATYGNDTVIFNSKDLKGFDIEVLVKKNKRKVLLLG